MGSSRIDRRLAAVLAADVVGYARLMERDEVGTLDRLKSYRKERIDPLLAEHHGRVVKLMGDGALCEFGSVIDAVVCAVAIQEAIEKQEVCRPDDERIRFRIGINLGDIIVDGEDIHGEGVNVAARLEQLAEPGAVFISEAVRQHVEGKLAIGFKDLGPQRIKNIDRLVRVFKVIPFGAVGGNHQQSQLRPRRANRSWALALLALLVLTIGLVFWAWRLFDWYYQHTGASAYLSGHPQEAIVSYHRANQLTLESRLFLIASYVAVGRESEARIQAQEVLKEDPRFSVSDYIAKTKKLQNFDEYKITTALVAAGLPLNVRWECLVRNQCP
jgi:class 3 adenylate cyclase